MIRLIVTDVDDTLVPESSMDLNPEYFEVIRQLQAKGVVFVAASGRQKTSIKKVFAPVQDEIAYLADNGTDISARDFTRTMRFDDGDYRKLAQELETLSDRGFTYMPSKPDWNFIDEKEQEFYELTLSYGCQIQTLPDLKVLEGITKVSLYHPDGIPKDLENRLKAEWSDRLDVCIAGRVYLDFTGKNCNKGRALSIIQEHYGVSYDETAAFGNADNDIFLLERARYSYAVGNASENLKKIASETIGTMEEDAVLAKLKEILAGLD